MGESINPADKKELTVPELMSSRMNIDPDATSALGLAYIGDAVWEILVRTKVLSEGNRQVEKLHHASIKYVQASAQAARIESIMDKLTEEELAVYRRGRNAKPHTMPKNQSSGDYHKATGFEALIGWLYLKGEIERIRELVEI